MSSVHMNTAFFCLLGCDNSSQNHSVGLLEWTYPWGTYRFGLRNPQVMSVNLLDEVHSFSKPYGIWRINHQELYASLEPTILEM